MTSVAIEFDSRQLAGVNRVLDRLRYAGSDPEDLLHD